MPEFRRFVHGEIYAEAFLTDSGPYQIDAQVEIQGTRLVLRDFSVEPCLAKRLPLTVRGGLMLRRQLVTYAMAEGYTDVEICGVRLSGANPNRAIRYLRKGQ